MSSVSNAIQLRLALLQDQWTEFALDPRARLLRWVVAPDEVCIVEALWARESDERAAETPDLFLRLRSSFEDPERHGLSLRRELVEMVGEPQETLAEEGPRTRWTCPALVSGANDVQALVAALEGFRVAHAPSEGVVGVWLDPQEIGDERLYVAWLQGLAKAAPGGYRCVVLEDSARPAFEELASGDTLQGPLGHGWHHPLDLRLIETKNAVAVRMPDGRAVAFPPVAEGGEYRDRKERATLSRDERGYALRDSEGLIYRFAPGCPEQECLLQSIEDTGANRIALSYDDKGRLERVVDSGGRRFDFAFDGFDRISAIEGPDPSTPAARMTLVRYFYDSSGNLVAVQDALGQQTRFEYEGHLLTREMNRNGLSFYFKYDGADEKARCVRTWGDGGIYDHKLSYNLEAYITTVEDSLGHKTIHHHQDGMVFKTVDALGNTTMTERKSYAEVAVETNAIGLNATHEYDDRGNEIARTDYDGAVTRFAYEGDRLLEMTDAVGGKWSAEYDAKGRVPSARTRWANRRGTSTTSGSWSEPPMRQITGRR